MTGIAPVIGSNGRSKTPWRATGSRGGHPTTSRLDCEECGDEIPLARRRVVSGCRFCIECQRTLELKKGRV